MLLKHSRLVPAWPGPGPARPPVCPTGPGPGRAGSNGPWNRLALKIYLDGLM
jgi:hypothetical protein